MASNLIFHTVSKRKWQEFNKGGNFDPEGSKYDEGIVCVTAGRLKEFINTNFKGRRRLFVLVIDKSRLINRAEFDKENELYVVKNKINMDSILDKIELRPNKEGVFDIEVTED